MKRRLCAAILTLEAIVLGLTTPVLLSVQDVTTAQGLVIGLGLMLLCIVAAGMLGRPWGYWLGWAVQVLAIALGLEIRVMVALGLIFLALWFTAVTLGERIESHQRLAVAQLAPVEEAAPVVAPEHWDHELVCEESTWRPYAARAFAAVWPRNRLVLAGLGVLAGLLLFAFAPQARIPALAVAVMVALAPAVTWLAQRSAWRTFVGPGSTYRTAFGADHLVLEAGGRLFEVGYAEISDVEEREGIVSTAIGASGARMEVPDAVFPPAEVARVRSLLAG